MAKIREEFNIINQWLACFDLELHSVNIIDKKHEEVDPNNKAKKSFTINYSKPETEAKVDAFRALKVD